MGKKSLLEPTPEPKKRKKTPASGKTVRKKAGTTRKLPAEPEVSPSISAAEKPAPDVSPSGPEPGKLEMPVPDRLFFESDPLVDKKLLLLGIAGVSVLILIILIASMINYGNYYVKQGKGAVEVWKGDFSPVGKDRIMILHGTYWDRPVKESYSRGEVFPFAFKYYLEKAAAMAESPVSDDFDRIVYYLDRSLELASDRQFKKMAVIITQARQSLIEARVLQESGEKESVALAQKKINTASRALTGLIADMEGGGGR